MCAIGFALPGAVGMNMHISDHGEPAAFAQVPKRAEKAAIKAHYSSIKTVGIEIVVKDEADNP